LHWQKYLTSEERCLARRRPVHINGVRWQTTQGWYVSESAATVATGSAATCSHVSHSLSRLHHFKRGFNGVCQPKQAGNVGCNKSLSVLAVDSANQTALHDMMLMEHCPC